MRLIAFGASSSKESINKKLASYAARLASDLNQNTETEILDLNDFELPLFSEDVEKETGQPASARRFLDKIGSADYLIISFAEHNGFYTAAYKNLFDWCTRINPKVYQNKPMLLLATSPGGRGAKTVLDLATHSLHRFGGDIRASLSVPSFHQNFNSETQQLSNEEIKSQLLSALKQLIS